MSYAFVADAQGCTTSSVSELASASSIGVGLGDWLWVVGMKGNGGAAWSLPTDTLGNTFTLLTAATTQFSLWYCPASVAAGSSSCTIAASGNNNSMQLYYSAYSGLMTSVLGYTTSQSNSGTTYSSADIDATTVPAMLWSFAVDISDQPTAPVVYSGSGLTARTGSVWTCSSPYNLNAIGDKRVTSPGNVQAQFTFGGQFDGCVMFTAVVPEAATGGVPQMGRCVYVLP